MNARRLTYGLAVVFGLIGPALFLRNVNLSDWVMLVVELGFALWLLSPFVLVALAVRSEKFSSIGALIATILAGPLNSDTQKIMDCVNLDRCFAEGNRRWHPAVILFGTLDVIVESGKKILSIGFFY